MSSDVTRSTYSEYLLSGQSPEAQGIANALGLEAYHVKALQLIIEADRIITVKATIYPTAEQVRQLGGEIEKFRGFGTTIANIDFNYNHALGVDIDD